MFTLLQELFKISMEGNENMYWHLRTAMEKMSELSIVGLKLEDEIKLGIIHNSLPEQCRYSIMSSKEEEKIGFNEPTARLLDEEMKVAKTTTMITIKTDQRRKY
jgi:LTR polyprotein gag-polypeptide-like protein